MRGRIAGVLAVALLLSLPAAADAAFPGQNGKILYYGGDGNLYTVAPDGTGASPAGIGSSGAWSPDGHRIAAVDSTHVYVRNADGTGNVDVTPNTAPQFSRPVDVTWSPDGTQLVYTNDPVCNPNPASTGTPGLLVKMNADGSNPVRLVCQEASFQTNHGGGGVSWASNGQVIAFEAPTGPGHVESIWKINADGTGLTDLTGVGDPAESWPDWSPDASNITYVLDELFGGSIRIVDADGSNAFTVAADGTVPVWSPDGTKIAFGRGGDIWVMNSDGTGQLNITNTPSVDESPRSWQPLLRGYARPKAATPMYTPLVPAHTPCTSPNRVHAAPLSYNSCNPPSQTSGFATVGTPDANGVPAKSVGSLKLVAIGEVPINTGNGNQSDVVIDFDISDVRNPGTLTDYTGGLRVRSALQITDRNNTPYPGGPGPGTVVPATFEFNVPCATTADTTVGSTCSTSTTANAVLPGQVLERQRAIWELGRVEVHDGGTDGNPSTAGDNTLFATQGVFIP